MIINLWPALVLNIFQKGAQNRHFPKSPKKGIFQIFFNKKNYICFHYPAAIKYHFLIFSVEFKLKNRLLQIFLEKVTKNLLIFRKEVSIIPNILNLFWI